MGIFKPVRGRFSVVVSVKGGVGMCGIFLYFNYLVVCVFIVGVGLAGVIYMSGFHCIDVSVMYVWGLSELR